MNPLESPVRPQRLSATALSLGILAVIAVGAVLKIAQAVVIPLLIAWFLSYLLAPVVTFLVRRLRLPAVVAVVAVVVEVVEVVSDVVADVVLVSGVADVDVVVVDVVASDGAAASLTVSSPVPSPDCVWVMAVDA